MQVKIAVISCNKVLASLSYLLLSVHVETQEFPLLQPSTLTSVSAKTDQNLKCRIVFKMCARQNDRQYETVVILKW